MASDSMYGPIFFPSLTKLVSSFSFACLIFTICCHLVHLICFSQNYIVFDVVF
jgi:hypothetical protein